MKRFEASKIFNAECSSFLCMPEFGGLQHLKAMCLLEQETDNILFYVFP